MYRETKGTFPYTSLCIWETGWVNEFQQHLTNKSFTIIETEKDACESVFHKLQDSSTTVFLEPILDIMEKYVIIHDHAIILKPLVTEAPLQEVSQVNIPTIEKLLVDLFCDDEIFYFFQGRELQHIWKNAFGKYSIQHDRLLRYASRRKRKDEISGLMKKSTRQQTHLDKKVDSGQGTIL